MESWKIGMFRKSGKNNKKKIQKNGFYYFMMEYNKTKLQGKCTDFRRLQGIAEEDWKLMSIEEREPFELMANRARNRCGLDTKTEQYGMPHSDVSQTIERQNEMMKLARLDIEEKIFSLDAATSLQTAEFYFVHANSHVLTSSGIVVPCELAVCRYSIKEGVMDAYSVILNIRPIPLGYAADAYQNSATLHKIPAPAEGLGETDARKVYREFLQFLMPNKPLNGELEDLADIQFPPVYTVHGVADLTGKCINSVQACCMPSAESPIPLLNVYPIEYLMHVILKNIIQSVKLGNADIPEELEACQFAENENLIYNKFHYDYYSQAPEIACQFHEEQDCREHCSKSWSIRMSYTISNYCCNLLGVKRQRWRHYATNNMNITIRTSRPIFLNRPQQELLDEDPLIDEKHLTSAEDLAHFEPPDADSFGSEVKPAIAPAVPVSRKQLHPDAPPFHPPVAPEFSASQSNSRSVVKMPQKLRSMYDDDDDDTSSIISSSSISTLRSLKKSLDIDSVLDLAGHKASSTMLPESPVNTCHRSEMMGPYGVFDMNQTPEYDYMRNRAGANRMEELDDDVQSVATTTDSFASVPLQRYKKPTIAVTNMSNILAKPVPERSLYPAYMHKTEPLNTEFSLDELIPVQGGQSLSSYCTSGQEEDEDEDEDVAARILTRIEQQQEANAAAHGFAAQWAVPHASDAASPSLMSPAGTYMQNPLLQHHSPVPAAQRRQGPNLSHDDHQDSAITLQQKLYRMRI
ncbi:protein maelstrom isoform X2 [Cloeon dipterum]|uniref:protein maelstrom isoform X2 n=1 Tax=Cloeon dipterum TaxID=197152 RepID=UPI00322005E9